MTASTAVHSNAFNFLSFIQTGVDPRTGLYTVSLSLRELLSNYLRGPLVPLTLNYNPLNEVDSGYGIGWDLKLSQYTPANQVVSVHSGETLKVSGPYGGVANRMRMKEQKIESFQFYQLPDSTFRLVHKSGLVEILELKGAIPQVAVPVRMYSPQGHEISLDYGTVNGVPMLASIRDKNGLLLQVTRDTVAHTVSIGLTVVEGEPLAEVVLDLKNDRVERITLPTAENAGWRFEYRTEHSLQCISEVWTPLGAHETVQYNDQGHGFPGNAQRKLPRVTDHTTDPGGGQAPIVVKYTYGADGHNFLGSGSGIIWTDDGLDNLYKVLEPYAYHSTETLMVGTAAVRSVTREFNRFHLLVSEKTLEGTHQQTKKSHYYADDNDKLSFDQQPRQCQLLKELTTRWELTDDPRTFREDKEKSEYDIYGNQTLSVQASGITEATIYYPAAGVPGKCPADPYGFVRHVEQTTVTPSTDPDLVPGLQTGAPTTRTRHRYVELPPLASSAIQEPWVTSVEQSSFEVVGQSEVLLEIKNLDFFNTPTDPLIHGLTQLETITLAGAERNYVSQTGYAYSIKTDEQKSKRNQANRIKEVLLGETVFSTTETFTGHDDLVKVVGAERSLLNGEPLLTQDKDIKIRNTYDALLRVLTETVAPDDPLYSATRTYTYRLVRPSDNGVLAEQASQEVENVKKVKTRTWFDGLNRPVREEQQDIDFSAGAYRDIYQATYNPRGQLIEEQEVDWLELESLNLKTTYTFDAWGEQSSSTDPAGVTQYTEVDPIAFTSTEWTEGMGKTITTTNRLEKPVKVERFDLSEESISTHSYLYDGLGRTALEKNAAGYETSYIYDVFDRMQQTTLPTMDKVVREYAGHSRADLPTLIKVGETVLGTQVFDSLERISRSTTGGRVTSHEYDTSYSKANRIVQPTGDVIHYEYAYELTDEPLTRNAVAGEATNLEKAPQPIMASYAYDPKDARLVSSSELEIQLGRTYNVQGDVKTETRTVKDVVDPYEMTYVYSRLGRLLRYHDVIGQTQLFQYDQTTGRLTFTQLGEKGSEGYVRSDFTYNAQGLTKSTSTVDSTDQQVSVELAYDDLGRETLRTFDLNGTRSWLEQVWNGLDQIEQRNLSEGASQGETALRDETYSYELRGRLEEYTCQGPQSPKDPYGNVMTRQVFFFDALDNHEQVRTTFIKGTATESNTARFEYTNTDPAQLTRITNSHADYPDIELEYDANGNLTRDEANRTLAYDLLSRLVEVGGSDSEETRYTYDGNDRLAGSGSGADKEQRFYREDKPFNSVGSAQNSTFVSANDVMLAELQEGASPKSLMLASDDSGSILAETESDTTRHIGYTPYGRRIDGASVCTGLAYNGELLDGATGGYLLGQGYRVFSPFLMRFQQPDFGWSPFGRGGVNAYGYGLGDPIRNIDPTGRWSLFKSLSRLFGGSKKAPAKSAGLKTAPAKSVGPESASPGSPIDSLVGFVETSYDHYNKGLFKRTTRVYEPDGVQTRSRLVYLEHAESNPGRGLLSEPVATTAKPNGALPSKQAKVISAKQSRKMNVFRRQELRGKGYLFEELPASRQNSSPFDVSRVREKEIRRNQGQR